MKVNLICAINGRLSTKGPKLFKLGRAIGVTLYRQGTPKGKKKQIIDKTLNDGQEEEKKGENEEE